jgi:uncharacterized membrane protein YadS
MATTVNKPTEKTATNTTLGFFIGLAIVVALAFLARWLKIQVYGAELPLGIPGRALEYPLWAALVGLVANYILKATNVYDAVKHGFRTELFLKTGLVLLGASISFSIIFRAAGGAVLQGIIMVASVYFFSWWLGGKLGLPDTLRAVMSTAVSICGVSAAIAAAGSVLAKKEEITYVTALVIVTSLPLMVIAPLLAGAMNMPEPIAGAWFGGNVDTTAAVVGAGTMYGETAQKIASIVKQTQNALIGFVAFGLALYFTTVVEGKKEKPNISLVWKRFPKFVLGFLIASLIYTITIDQGWLTSSASQFKAINATREWAFCLAFVCMGLELSAGAFKKMGWSPVIVYLVVTVFNTILALGLAWAIFGWLFPAGSLL